MPAIRDATFGSPQVVVVRRNTCGAIRPARARPDGRRPIEALYRVRVAGAAGFRWLDDLAPWNLIVGERWVFIDWDAAAPSTRLWDLAYAAQAFTLSDVDRPTQDAAGDVAAFVDGYRADAALRDALPTVMHRRAAAMLELLRSGPETGREPWASMFASGHGDHRAAVTQYVAGNQSVWSDALGQTR